MSARLSTLSVARSSSSKLCTKRSSAFDLACGQQLPAARHPAGEFDVAEIGAVGAGRRDIDAPAIAVAMEHPQLAPAFERLHGQGQGRALRVDARRIQPHGSERALAQQRRFRVVLLVDEQQAGLARLAGFGDELEFRLVSASPVRPPSATHRRARPLRCSRRRRSRRVGAHRRRPVPRARARRLRDCPRRGASAGTRRWPRPPHCACAGGSSADPDRSPRGARSSTSVRQLSNAWRCTGVMSGSAHSGRVRASAARAFCSSLAGSASTRRNASPS